MEIDIYRYSLLIKSQKYERIREKTYSVRPDVDVNISGRKCNLRLSVVIARLRALSVSLSAAVARALVVADPVQSGDRRHRALTPYPTGTHP